MAKRLHLLLMDASDAARPDAPRGARIAWLERAAAWIRAADSQTMRRYGPRKVELSRSGRLRLLLDAADSQPQWRSSVSAVIRAVAVETSAIRLYTETGLPRS